VEKENMDIDKIILELQVLFPDKKWKRMTDYIQSFKWHVITPNTLRCEGSLEDFFKKVFDTTKYNFHTIYLYDITKDEQGCTLVRFNAL